MLEVKMYSVKDMAVIMEVSERTIFNYIKEGKLKGAVKIGGRWKISEENLRDFLQGKQS